MVGSLPLGLAGAAMRDGDAFGWDGVVRTPSFHTCG